MVATPHLAKVVIDNFYLSLHTSGHLQYRRSVRSISLGNSCVTLLPMGIMLEKKLT